MHSRYVLAAILICTLLAYHTAWEGWFQDDDLDNLSWAATASASSFVRSLASPVFVRDTFRPTGHLVYHFVAKFAGESYLWYLAALQIFHLLNIGLLWWLLRKLGVGLAATAIAVAFFAVHPACFAAGWRPMFYFDILCGLFCLLSLMCWIQRRWVLAFVFFWIAYRAKEPAVALPAVLAVWEFLFGQRRWKPLIPFFLVSASFGIQAVLANRGTHDPYTLHPTPAAFWECLQFYSRQLMFPWSALLLTIVAVLLRDRRAWFGILWFWVFLAPMLVLPGRLNGLYLYVALAGAAIVIATAVQRLRAWQAEARASQLRVIPQVVMMIGIAAWFMICAVCLIRYEASELAIDADNRAYMRVVAASVMSHPEIQYYVFQGRPPEFRPWGVSGGATFIGRNRKVLNDGVTAEAAGEIDLAAFANRVPATVLCWDPDLHRATALTHTTGTPLWPYLPMQPVAPLWQLGKGWYTLEIPRFRWTAPHAEAHLSRPADARWFEIVAVAPDPASAGSKESVLRVSLDGRALEPRTFNSTAFTAHRWNLDAAPAARDVAVTMDIDPGFTEPPDGRMLALKIYGFGFKE